MKVISMGVAGHIDHGKTTLVKFLTGKDTDHLKDEKERGISINIAFSFIEYPDLQIGLIDMPGHRDFIKNMIAGATSIRSSILVVAADDGIMPQTIEHVNILRLMGVKNIFVVISKLDLVEPDRVIEVQSDVEKLLKESKFSTIEFSRVRADDEKTYKACRIMLKSFVENLKEEVSYLSLRLDVDRSFSLNGVGTVVTGTLRNQPINVGDSLMIYPKKVEFKVKSLQSNAKDVETAYPGQRTAIHFTELKYNEVKRGDIVSSKIGVFETDKIDVEFEYVFDNNAAETKSKMDVVVYIGTTHYNAHLSILGQKTIEKNNTYFGQIFFKEKHFFSKGDFGIVKFINSEQINAGFKILRQSIIRSKWNNEVYKKDLETLSNGNVYDRSKLWIKTDRARVIDVKTLWCQLCVDDFKKDEDLIIYRDYICHIDTYEYFKKSIAGALEKFHFSNPMKMGLGFNSLFKQFEDEIGKNEFSVMLNMLVQNNVIKYEVNFYALKHFTVVLTEEQKRLKNFLIKRVKEYGLKIKPITTLKDKTQNTKEFNTMLKYLVDLGSFIMLDFDFYVANSWYQNAIEQVKTYIAKQNSIDLKAAQSLWNINSDQAKLILQRMERDRVLGQTNNKWMLIATK